MTTTTEHRPIDAIEADLSGAMQQVLATAEAHKEAKQRHNELTGELHRARVAATVQALTEDQLWDIANDLPQQPWGIGSRWTDVVAFVRAAEAAHGITATTAAPKEPGHE